MKSVALLGAVELPKSPEPGAGFVVQAAMAVTKAVPTGILDSAVFALGWAAALPGTWKHLRALLLVE